MWRAKYNQKLPMRSSIMCVYVCVCLSVCLGSYTFFQKVKS
jgi:hypothetical protein